MRGIAGGEPERVLIGELCSPLMWASVRCRQSISNFVLTFPL
jgi:hypothetical protein